jgi:hypothetical protein
MSARKRTRVRLSLFAPKGELRGALLKEGTVVRKSPKQALAWADRLCPGAVVAAMGEVFRYPDSTVIEAVELGATPETLRPVKRAWHAAWHLWHGARQPGARSWHLGRDSERVFGDTASCHVGHCGRRDRWRDPAAVAPAGSPLAADRRIRLGGARAAALVCRTRCHRQGH